VIPSIPPRAGLLQRAVASALSQTHQPSALSVVIDHERQGAAGTRQRALDAVQTEWTAFLDDDDEFLPEHLAKLADHALATQADFAYSWFETVPAGRDPFPPLFLTEPWHRNNPRHTTITVLVRTELAKEVGFCLEASTPQFANEDWAFILRCNELGKISHLCGEKTWLWHHDSGNTSGLPTRW
jgi:glycosyltransferase involved in cell wall biosynthesis